MRELEGEVGMGEKREEKRAKMKEKREGGRQFTAKGAMSTKGKARKREERMSGRREARERRR